MPSGTLSMPRDHACHSHPVEVVGPGLLDLRVLDATITSIRLPASTSLMSVIERSWPIASGVSASGNGTLSRSGSTGSAFGRAVSRSPVTASPLRRGCGCSCGSPNPPPLRSEPPHGLLGPGERDLHLEHAVLVRGAGGARRPPRRRAHEPAERAVLDLDLLVKAPGRGRGRRSPAISSWRPRISSATSVMSIPERSALTTARGGCRCSRRHRRREATHPLRPVCRSNTSPKSSSISRRMRSKLANRSRWLLTTPEDSPRRIPTSPRRQPRRPERSATRS